MISQQKIDEIRDRSDILALIGEHVDLKRAGAGFKGLCPFHSEKTPSFQVRPENRHFHCFGCHASGDAIAFVMQLEGRSFPEALRILAERAGIELPDDADQDDEEYRLRRKRDERYAAIMDASAGFFVSLLENDTLAALGREELKARGVHKDTMKTFRLGYAPESWDALGNHLSKQGFSVEDAESVGMLVPRKGGDGHYDRFRNRLMFPVSDIHGRIVAFSGRRLPSATLATPQTESDAGESKDASKLGAKYVNSPESPVYTKGDVLFGLHESRIAIRREGWAILCEGNFDVLALHQAGFKNAVAPLGTALTEHQIKLLHRYTQKVVVLFDGDQAGKAAVRKAQPLLHRAGISAKVVSLPVGSDPDSFLREHGVEPLQQRIDAASGIVEHLIDEAAYAAGGDAGSKAAAIADLAEVLAGVQNSIEERIYVERIGRRFGITDLDAIGRQLRCGSRQNYRAHNGRHDPTSTASSHSVTRPGTSRIGGAEWPPLQLELIGVFLDNPELLARAEAKALEELLTSSQLQAIFQSAIRVVNKRGGIDAALLLEDLSANPAVNWLEGRLAIHKYDPSMGEQALRDGIPRLAKNHIEQELPQLQKKILDARRVGDESKAAELTQQHVALFRSARKLVQGIQR